MKKHLDLAQSADGFLCHLGCMHVSSLLPVGLLACGFSFAFGEFSNGPLSCDFSLSRDDRRSGTRNDQIPTSRGSCFVPVMAEVTRATAVARTVRVDYRKSGKKSLPSGSAALALFR